MKRILCAVMALLMMVAMTGCGEYHQGVAGTRPSQQRPSGPVDVNSTEAYTVTLMKDGQPYSPDIEIYAQWTDGYSYYTAKFDENGFAIGDYDKKPSYYAYQNLIGLFGNGAKKEDLPIILKGPDFTEKVFGQSEKLQNLITQGFTKDNGSSAFLYYKPTDIMTTSFEGVVSFACDFDKEKIRLVDLMSGKVYRLPDDMMEDLGSGMIKLSFLPIRDYPFAITFGDFCEVE